MSPRRTHLTAQGSTIEAWTQDEIEDPTIQNLKRLDLDELGLSDDQAEEEQDTEPGFNPYDKHG